MEINKVICPHCTQPNCFVEETVIKDQEVVHSFMCMDCGYTSTTVNIEGSDLIKAYEETTAEIIKQLRWVDANTKLVWYPIVLNFPSTGMIFPDGSNKDSWNWMAAPAVDIPFNQQKKYPIPGQRGQFYTKRVDLTKGKHFAPDQFADATKFVGFVQEV